jgi:hypothetical protein
MIWSRRDSESRTLPSPRRATISSAARSASIPSALQMRSSCAIRSFSSILRRMNFCTRERMVCGTLCISVVANMKITCGGGSSMSFSSAFHEAAESMCASSMMKMR